MIEIILSALRWQFRGERAPGVADAAQAGILEFLMAYPLAGYVGVVIVLSVITFLVYGWDKRQARTDGWRVPEKRLHALAFLGGWPGAVIGQNYFRHKTQKLEFKVATWGAAMLHLILVCWCIYQLMVG